MNETGVSVDIGKTTGGPLEHLLPDQFSIAKTFLCGYSLGIR